MKAKIDQFLSSDVIMNSVNELLVRFDGSAHTGRCVPATVGVIDTQVNLGVFVTILQVQLINAPIRAKVNPVFLCVTREVEMSNPF